MLGGRDRAAALPDQGRHADWGKHADQDPDREARTNGLRGVKQGLLAVAAGASFALSLGAAAHPRVAQESTVRSAPSWSDSFVSRVEALALIQTLNGEILASTSATTTLEKWCRDHHLAEDPQIVAHRTRGAEQPPTWDSGNASRPLTTSVSGTDAWSSRAETGSSPSRTTGMCQVA